MVVVTVPAEADDQWLGKYCPRVHRTDEQHDHRSCDRNDPPLGQCLHVNLAEFVAPARKIVFRVRNRTTSVRRPGRLPGLAARVVSLFQGKDDFSDRATVLDLSPRACDAASSRKRFLHVRLYLAGGHEFGYFREFTTVGLDRIPQRAHPITFRLVLGGLCQRRDERSAAL